MSIVIERERERERKEKERLLERVRIAGICVSLIFSSCLEKIKKVFDIYRPFDRCTRQARESS